MRWLQRALLIHDREGWRDRARESIVDLNDGIVSAAGIGEGFAAAGATTRALVFAGVTVVLTGGFAAAASCYAEERTVWEMHHRMIEAERASIEADPAGELEELVATYEAKGLESGLARQVAEALTARDAVAAHADAELDLDSIAPARANIFAAVSAGLFFGLGAAVPLVAVRYLPTRERSELEFAPVLLALGLTGWFAAWVTGLPAVRLVVRNLVLGGCAMAAGLIIGHAVAL
jgi:VIT1/CCC1 family predicted Fe2+/Mn2+ transporter